MEIYCDKIGKQSSVEKYEKLPPINGSHTRVL